MAASVRSRNAFSSASLPHLPDDLISRPAEHGDHLLKALSVQGATLFIERGPYMERCNQEKIKPQPREIPFFPGALSASLRSADRAKSRQSIAKSHLA